MKKAEQPNNNEPTTYALRLTQALQQEIDAEYVRLVGISGIDIANDWEDRLLKEIRGLATYPKRGVKAVENEAFQRVHPGQTLRVLIFQRSRSSPTWRILFSVHEADALDAPRVIVRHIWHGAREPNTFWPDEDEE